MRYTHKQLREDLKGEILKTVKTYLLHEYGVKCRCFVKGCAVCEAWKIYRKMKRGIYG